MSNIAITAQTNYQNKEFGTFAGGT